MEPSDSDVECSALFGQIRPYQLEPYAARRPEGKEVAAGVDVVRVGNTDGKLRYRSRQPAVPVTVSVTV